MYTPRNAAGLDPATLSEFQYLSARLNAFVFTTTNAAQTVTSSALSSLIIPPNTVSYEQMQNVSAGSRVLGRGDGGSGDPQELDLGAGLSITGTTLNVASFAADSWTPIDSSGAALVFASAVGVYQRMGDVVVACASVTYPATADASAAVIGGLPATSRNTAARVAAGLVVTDAGAVAYQVNTNATTLRLVSPSAATSIVNSTLSGKVLTFTVMYLA